MTAEEFWDWCGRPEHRDGHFELDRGVVVEWPRTGERHGMVCANAAFLLENHARRAGRGYALCNRPGFVLGRGPDTVLTPDVAYMDVNRSTGELSPTFARGAPALAVDVLSPWETPNRAARRAVTFLAAGTRAVWLVDPDDLDVSVWRPDRPPQVLVAGGELTGDHGPSGFRCRVADLFYAPGDGGPPG